jgi:hypothetical protein
LRRYASRQAVEFLVVFLAGLLLGGVLTALYKNGNLKDGIAAVQAALVPVIALLASYIAYRQARTAELKRKQDLYQMRMETYHALRDFMISIQQKDALDFENLTTFTQKTTESYFLFDEEIDGYLEELRNKAMEHWRLGRQREKLMEKEDDPRITQKIKAYAEEEVEISVWISKQLKEAKMKFSPFLRLE